MKRSLTLGLSLAAAGLIGACDMGGGSTPEPTPAPVTEAPAVPAPVPATQAPAPVILIDAANPDSGNLRSSQNVTVTRETDQAGTFFVLQGTAEGVGSGGGTGGAHFGTGETFENAVSGKRVRVTLDARAATPGQVWIAYSTNDTGNSGWVPFVISDVFSTIVFEYDVPAKSAGGNDFVGIIGSPETGTDIVHIRSVKVEVL